MVPFRRILFKNKYFAADSTLNIIVSLPTQKLLIFWMCFLVPSFRSLVTWNVTSHHWACKLPIWHTRFLSILFMTHHCFMNRNWFDCRWTFGTWRLKIWHFLILLFTLVWLKDPDSAIKFPVPERSNQNTKKGLDKITRNYQFSCWTLLEMM